MPKYIHFLNKDITFYGLMFALGVIATLGFLLINSKKEKLEKFDVASSFVFVIIGVIIGAKLLSILTSIKIIIEYKLSFFDVLRTGFVFYGGLIGGIIGLFFYCKIYKVNLSTYFNLYAAALPIGHAIGRVGCFLSGCCYGIKHSGFLSFTYHDCYNLDTPLNVGLLPIQLIESFFLIILFIILQILFYKQNKKICAYIYLYFYAILRFILEFFRGDLIRGKVAVFSTSQIISICIIVFTTIYLIIKKKKTSKNPS